MLEHSRSAGIRAAGFSADVVPGRRDQPQPERGPARFQLLNEVSPPPPSAKRVFFCPDHTRHTLFQLFRSSHTRCWTQTLFFCKSESLKSWL